MKTITSQRDAQRGVKHAGYNSENMIVNPYGGGKTLSPTEIARRIFQGEQLLKATQKERSQLRDAFGLRDGEKSERMIIAAHFGSESGHDSSIVARTPWKVLDALANTRDKIHMHHIASLIFHYIQHYETDKNYCPYALAPSVENVTLANLPHNLHTIDVMFAHYLQEIGQPTLDDTLLQEEPAPLTSEEPSIEEEEPAPLTSEEPKEVSIHEPINKEPNLYVDKPRNRIDENVAAFNDALDRIIAQHVHMPASRKSEWEETFENMMADANRQLQAMLAEQVKEGMIVFANNADRHISDHYARIHQEQLWHTEEVQKENTELRATIAHLEEEKSLLQQEVANYRTQLQEIRDMTDMLRGVFTPKE